MMPKLNWSKYVAPVTTFVQARSVVWSLNEFTVTPSAIRKGIGYGFPVLVVAGAIFPPVGLICLAGMCAALALSPLNGRYWCAWFCPRGLFYEHWLARINPQKHVPPLIKTRAFRLAWLIVLMSVLGVAVLRSQGNVFMIARSVMIMIIVTTAIGIGLGLQYYSRLWCMFCPIGTMSNWLGKGKNPVRIDGQKCVNCQLCAMSCPMAIQPQTFRSVGNIAHGDCLKCGKCVQVCPQQALDLPSWTQILARFTNRLVIPAQTPGSPIAENQQPVRQVQVVGLDHPVPLLNGRQALYVNLDNAATTPALQVVKATLDRLLPYYSSVHRGNGFKSRLCSALYDQAHELVGQFVNADLQTNTVIFGKNTTEAINKLAHRFPFAPDAVVLTTQMEHHSNDLPWRDRAQVVHLGLTPEGRLDEADVDRQLAQYGRRVALLAVSGASNVTGFMPPIHRLARKAHAVGAKILVDAAQLAPHRRIDMKADDDAEHLDFVALSAHKMYAPFGVGALIGAKATFLHGAPEYKGGGTVDAVTLHEVDWAGLPDREEAGSPNTLGAIALAAAAQALQRIGMDQIAAHEQTLLAYAFEHLRVIPGITIYGETDPGRLHDKVGVLTFNLADIPHALVAAILGYEGGIGVRSGCFCAHPYVMHLLRLSEDDVRNWRQRVARGEKAGRPGMVRISFGCYNTISDVDRLITMLECIARGDYQGQYQLNPQTGEYQPLNYQDTLHTHFSFASLDEEMRRTDSISITH